MKVWWKNMPQKMCSKCGEELDFSGNNYWYIENTDSVESAYGYAGKTTHSVRCRECDEFNEVFLTRDEWLECFECSE